MDGLKLPAGVRIRGGIRSGPIMISFLKFTREFDHTDDTLKPYKMYYRLREKYVDVLRGIVRRTLQDHPQGIALTDLFMELKARGIPHNTRKHSGDNICWDAIGLMEDELELFDRDGCIVWRWKGGTPATNAD